MSTLNGSVSIDDVLSRIEPRRLEVRICVDNDLVDRHAELEAALAKAVQEDINASGLTARSPELARQVQAIEDEMSGRQIMFRFESIGARAWTRLLAAHPPTAEQRLLRHIANPETFNTALVAASCVEPAMTDEQATALQDRLSAGQWQRLLSGALNVNQGGGEVPKSEIATGILLLSARSSTTAGPDTSPSQGSLADD